MYPLFDPRVDLPGEPSLKTKHREEYYAKRQAPAKPRRDVPVDRGFAGLLRASVQMKVGRFMPLI